MFSADDTLGHFLQIIGAGQVVGIKSLVLQIAAIAINLHLIDIGEACLTNRGIGKLVNT